MSLLWIIADINFKGFEISRIFGKLINK